MILTEYFAVMDEEGIRAGPFKTMDEAARFIRKTALNRGYTDQQAGQLFFRGSAVVKVETKNGKVVFSNLSWPPREESAERAMPAKMTEALPERVMAQAPPRPKRK